jgi:hypothetical protein
MASFTDLPPQFTPYVPQLPVEAMVQVGMAKQAKYEQGVQKIQAQIDQVAGMDVLRDVDKNYLQTKLNELGGNLTMFAAADFSNFQLVNSVAGMTKQIARDPIVQNSVNSTAWYKKQNEIIAKAKKDGKSSPENEWWFGLDVKNWLDDPNAGANFNSSYIEYRDVDKKLREVASKIKDVDQSVDIPFQRDDAGNVLYFKKDPKTGALSASTDPNSGGEKRIDDAMLRVKVKGTSAQKILDNFYTSLDENDKQQLLITGNYHYKDASKDTFISEARGVYNKKVEFLKDYVTDLAVKLKTQDGLSDETRSAMEAAMNEANRKLKDGDLEKELDKDISEINKISDIKDYKYRLYTNKYLTNLASNLANESKSIEYLTNPYAQMNMAKKNLEFQVERARVQDRHFMMTYGLSLANLQLARARDRREEIKFSQEQQDREKLEPVVEHGGLSSGVEVPTIATLDKTIGSTKAQLNELNYKYRNLLFPNLSGEGQDAALRKLIDEYAANPNNIKDPAQRKYVESARQLQNELARNNNLRLGVSEVSDWYNRKIDAELNNQPGYVENGKQILSARELYQLRAAVDNAQRVATYSGLPGAIPATPTVSLDAVQASLPDKLKPYVQIFIKRARNLPLTPTEQGIIRQSELVMANAGPNVRGWQILKSQKESEYLGKYMPEVQSTYGTLNISDKVTKAGIEYLIGNATETYNRMGALDVTNKESFNPATINTLRQKYGDEKLVFVAEKKFDGSGLLNVYGPSNEKQTIPMTPAQLQKYFPKVARQSFMTPVKITIMSSPGKTTNSMNADNPVTAYMSGYDIPALRETNWAGKVRLDIKGDPDNNGSDNDAFNVVMYVYDKNNWTKATSLTNRYLNAAEVEEVISNIGTQTVKDVLRQK